MGKLLERCQDLARRCGDLSALREPVRDRLWEGNKGAVLAGLTPLGAPVAPLLPLTLKRRKGGGPPRAPMGAGSRVVAGYVVAVDAGPGRLAFTGSWPGFSPVIEYLDAGTSRMAARPTFGHRPTDLDWVRDRLRAHVLRGE